MKVSVQYAVEHIEDLIIAAHNGEAVEIACAGQSALQLVRCGESGSGKSERVLGAGKAILTLPDEDELVNIDRQWKHEIAEKVFG